MADPVKVHHDAELGARIIHRTPLTYEGGADEATDRPAHVRAASSLAHVGEALAVIQDDANFLAMVDPEHHRARSIPLPAGPEGKRVFGAERGNIHHKLDLEACVSVPGTGGDVLVAFGSGSRPGREWVLTVDWRDADDPEISLHDAPVFYDALREEREFSGSGLNIEGAVFMDEDRLRLFQRGNAEPHDGLQPVDATGDISWSALDAHLLDREATAPPELTGIVQYEIGELDGVRLTFSDAERLRSSVLFSASAEAPGASDLVTGSVIGVIDREGARWAELIDLDGSPFGGKIEGLSLSPRDAHQLFFVVDDDDPGNPSDIFEVELSGRWYPEDASR